MTDAGEVVVVQVGENPRRSGRITPGAVLVSVDGDPALQGWTRPRCCSPAPRRRTAAGFQAATMLRDRSGPVRLAWRALDGSDRSASLIREFDVAPLLVAFDTANPAEGGSPPACWVWPGLYQRARFCRGREPADTSFGAELQSLMDARRHHRSTCVTTAAGWSSSPVDHGAFSGLPRLFDLYWRWRGGLPIAATSRRCGGRAVLWRAGSRARQR